MGSIAAATGKSLDFFADKGYNVNMKTAGDVNAFVQKGFASFFLFLKCGINVGGLYAECAGIVRKHGF